MRPVLTSLAIAGLAGATLHAALVVAPGIEGGIDARAEAAVTGLARHPVSVATRGREVELTGIAHDRAEAEALDAALRDVPGVVRVVDRIEILPRHAPYRFAATLAPDGAVTLEGAVPSAEAERRIVDAARGLSPGRPVTSRLVLAAGEPEDDWAGMVDAGLAALGTAEEGRLETEGMSARLAARLADAEAGRRASDTLAGAPGSWSTEIEVPLPIARPYLFSAERDADGRVSYSGNAPDAEHRDAFAGAARAAAYGDEAAGEIRLADGMPGPGWPGLVEAGLAALAHLTVGRLTVSPSGVRLAGAVPDAPTRERVEAIAADDWELALEIRPPEPTAELVVELAPSEAPETTGRLPAGIGPRELASIAPEIGATAALGTGGRTPGHPKGAAADAWRRAFEALPLLVPRVEEGRIEIAADVFAARGQLRAGFDAAGTREALRVMLGPDWRTEIALEAVPPAAWLSVAKTPAGVTLAGMLPEGVGEQTALVRVGGAEAAGLTTGGAGGDPRSWRRALDTLLAALAAFETAEGRIEDGRIALGGTLVAGHRNAGVARWIETRLGGDWRAELAAVEAVAANGAHRPALGGGTEVLAAGRWLPVLGFPANAAGCRHAASDPAIAAALDFAPGSATLRDPEAPALDRLAAVLIRCVEAAGLGARLVGHTDATGDPETNLELSAARAAALAEAMAARGVPLSALASAGMGASSPVADNATEAGRAANRRIEIAWRPLDRAVPDSQTPQPAETVGTLVSGREPEPDATLVPTSQAGADGTASEAPEPIVPSGASTAAAPETLAAPVETEAAPLEGATGPEARQP